MSDCMKRSRNTSTSSRFRAIGSRSESRLRMSGESSGSLMSATVLVAPSRWKAMRLTSKSAFGSRRIVGRNESATEERWTKNELMKPTRSLRDGRAPCAAAGPHAARPAAPGPPGERHSRCGAMYAWVGHAFADTEGRSRGEIGGWMRYAAVRGRCEGGSRRGRACLDEYRHPLLQHLTHLVRAFELEVGPPERLPQAPRCGRAWVG